MFLETRKKYYPHLGAVLSYQRKLLEEKKKRYGPQASRKELLLLQQVLGCGGEVEVNTLASRQWVEKRLRLRRCATIWGKVEKFLLLKTTTNTM